MKITLNKGQQLYFTSDCHYSHVNLCSGTSQWNSSRPGQVRDFKTLSLMNDTIVNNINNMVGEDDILFCLGDFAFGGIENIVEFRRRINCQNVYLIFGNHDEKVIDDKEIPFELVGYELYLQDLFIWCGHYCELEVIYPQVNKATKMERYNFVLSHFPFASWNKMGKGMMHLFGHLHLPKSKKLQQGKSLDVGIDGNDYKPYSLREVVNLLKNQPIKSTYLTFDHHLGD